VHISAESWSRPKLGGELYEFEAYLIRSVSHLCSEAVLVLLRVLGVGVLVQRCAVDGALKVLEADLALDGLCRGVLRFVSMTLQVWEGEAHGFQLRSGALLGLVRGALTLLLGFGSIAHVEYEDFEDEEVGSGSEKCLRWWCDEKGVVVVGEVFLD
jgi:hypothetical protein